MRACLLTLPIAIASSVAGCGGASPAGAELGSENEAAEARALLRSAEVEAARFGGEEQRRLLRLSADHKCPCPEPGTLSDCARAGSCVRARFAVRAILRGLARGDQDSDISQRLLERFGPRAPEVVDLSSAPCRGSRTAAAVLVVFSDFECPWCAVGRKLVEALEEKAGPQLRVCFKHLPLTSLHEHAQLAAQAGVAAQLQGRFWPMHDRLFDHQKQLARDELVEHARKLGLDLDRFRTDLDSPPVVERVKADSAEAARLRIRGTPTFLINGREMTDPKGLPDFLDWIAEAVALSRQKH